MLRPSTHRQRGFTLIEALIALVVLAVGLLGMAKLQAGSRQYQMESYQRAQAMVLLQDMVDRLSANRAAAACYAITTDTVNGTPWLGTGYSSTPVCNTGLAQQQARAVSDLQEWHQALTGASESIDDGGSTINVGAMINARGCITDATNNTYVVTVAWQGLMKTAAPTATCGLNQYGSEEERRAVSVTVRFGNLGP